MAETREKFISASELMADTPVWRERLGNYNDPLPNMKEISESEWAWRMGSLGGVQDFRQIPMVDLGREWSNGRSGGTPRELYHSVTFWVSADWSGIALTYDYTGEATRSEIDAYKLRFFKFAWCEHNMVGIPEESRMCYHVSQCTECGYKEAIDSSG